MSSTSSPLLDRYRLEEPIGAGGFSEVWRATDDVLQRPVAVKMLHPVYARHAGRRPGGHGTGRAGAHPDHSPGAGTARGRGPGGPPRRRRRRHGHGKGSHGRGNNGNGDSQS
ncbi:MAG TPA: hypothetical protein VMI33_09150 [Streptosporangiaceae bacterium]|nr:hypothetical protein [Streptosporangiaceae bacterium]